MIKNYTSNSKQTFDVIQKCLVSHGAQQIMFEYQSDGKVKSLNFALSVTNRLCGFTLPARVEKVEAIFLANKKPRYDWQKSEPLTQDEKDQAYRTAWANVRDWITAQMAFIETEQAKIEEIFLPYLIVGEDNKTLYEGMAVNKFMLPAASVVDND